jgi:hypothetical protein
MIVAIVLVSVLVGLGRATVPGHGPSWPGTYEALAHIWVGYLLGLVALGRCRRLALACLVVLTVLETVAFLLR